MKTRNYFTAAAAAWLGGLIGAAPATAWLWGDQSTAARPIDPSAVPVTESQIMIAGIIGILLIAAVAAGIRRYPLTYVILGVMTLAGVTLGGAYRVLYADVIGANIGAGLVLMFVLPFAGVLAIVGIILIIALRPRRQPAAVMPA